MDIDEKTTTTDTYSTTESACPKCEGRGWWGIAPVKCAECGGTGRLPENSAPEDRPGGLRYFTPAQAGRGLIQIVDEDRARAWAIAQLHPFGARCPECGLSLDNDKPFLEGKRCACGRCGKGFTARTGTILQGAQLYYGQAALLAALVDIMEKGLTPARVGELVGVSEDTVRLWQKKFRAFGE